MTKVLIYTVHKAASMFLHALAADVAEQLRLTHHSVNDERLYEPIVSASWAKYIEAAPDRSCFGPIRLAEARPNIPGNPGDYAIVAHLRDPRDVLTSQFFSYTYSHARQQKIRFNPSDEMRKKWEREGIDAFVLARAEQCGEEYRQFLSRMAHRDNVILLRYEDMVTDYSAWLRSFLRAFAGCGPASGRPFFGFRRRAPLKAVHTKLYAKYRDEFIPKAENVYEHKRQIMPGDHRRKLAPATIETLNSRLGDILAVLRYVP